MKIADDDFDENLELVEDIIVKLRRRKMILLLIALVAISIVTEKAVFAWIAIVIAALMLFSGGPSRQVGYFSPFVGGSIHVEPIWYHCEEHGNVPIHHVGRPTDCPKCHIQMKKGKKET